MNKDGSLNGASPLLGPPMLSTKRPKHLMIDAIHPGNRVKDFKPILEKEPLDFQADDEKMNNLQVLKQKQFSMDTF